MTEEDIGKKVSKERIYNRLNNNKKELSKYNNYKIIKDFCSSMFANGLSSQRIYRYLDVLLRFSSVVKKDFRKLDRKDIEKYLTWVESQPYTEWTKATCKIMVKRLMRWLNDEETPKIMKGIKIMRKNKTKLPSIILTPEEIEKLIQNASNVRNKALISLMYEGGLRLGELWSLRVRSVQFDKYGALVRIETGKTGQRQIRVVRCVPYLSMWIKQHPNPKPDSYLWLDETGQRRICYDMVRKILRIARDRAKIQKKIHPHLLRHSRCTHLAKCLTEQEMKVYFGWVGDSSMPDTYVHLSGKDLDNSILAIYGLKQRDFETENRIPVKCPRCSTMNNEQDKHCSNCGLALNLKEQVKQDKRAIIYDTIISQYFEQNPKAKKQLDKIADAIIKEGLK